MMLILIRNYQIVWMKNKGIVKFVILKKLAKLKTAKIITRSMNCP
jgi:hypothetical protein